MNDYEERLIRCFAGVFPDLNAREIPEASIKSVGSWDSVATLNLVSVLEEEFGVRFTPEQIDRFTSYESIAGQLLSVLKLSAPVTGHRVQTAGKAGFNFN